MLSCLVEKHNRLAAHDSVLGAAEREHVHAKVARSLPQRLSKSGRGIGDSRPIHVQKHFVLVRKMGERLNLFRLIHRPHLGRLRDRDDMRLHVMLVADPVIGVPHRVERDLAILMRQRNQLASRMLFRRATFVRINVRVLAAQNSMVRAVQRLQTEYVRASPVESKEHVDPGAKMFLKFRDSRTRVRVVAIGHHVSLVGARDRLQNFRMHPGIIVAGKAASRLVRPLRHKKTM